ncbi:hypothetical protein KFE25_002406 [Diacronema lutheri]|uniref:Uncharacterized protein n=1 Tax=Diacronema lutheri TaxID=2081491 RepID=A0A8J5XCR1_DIALT|nr:hypothetical protein KFE25_002406 [Diacronema lutheri]
MCKPPVVHQAVPIPGRKRQVLNAESTGDLTSCINCGCSLKRIAAKGPSLIIGAVPERVDRARFCSTECLYSHAFREALLFDDDDDE